MELGKLDEQWHNYPWVLGIKVFNFSTIFFLGLAPQNNVLVEKNYNRCLYLVPKKDSIMKRSRVWM